MDIDINAFVGSFVIDRWNKQYRWVRRINRVTKTQLVSDTQRVSDYEGDDSDKYTYFYFKKFAKRFKAVEAGTKFQVVEPKALELFNALKSEKSFKELFQTDVDEIQSKQQIIDDINKAHRKSYEDFKQYSDKRYKALSEKDIEDKLRHSGYIGHKTFEIYQAIPDIYENEFGREIDESENFTLAQLLTDYETYKKKSENRRYDFDSPIYEYLSNLFEKPVYRLGGTLRDDFVRETNTYSDLSNNMNWMQVTHFGNDAEHILDTEDSKNRTIAFWVFDECIVYQDGGGRSTW
jgi:hypothetical protein